MTPYRWLNDASQLFLERDYLLPGQGVDERVTIIAQNAERILGIDGFADKFIRYMKLGWFSLSSPIWTNFGHRRGLPISCFGSYIGDSMWEILQTHAEVGIMSKYGGGTSGFFGELRQRGSPINQNGESSGAVHFAQLFDREIEIISQGSSRRGQFAGYLPIDHGDIREWLTIRSDGSKLQSISFGVCVPDYWMKDMIGGDLEKRTTWAKLLECRANTGYPYIFFTDNANRQAPDCYKGKHKIHHSNLCTEIMLPNNSYESFVCDLSSMNILYYDEWKNTDAVETLTFFLDAVMTEFIQKADSIKFMERAVNFARNHRALGIGWLGWHSYLQSRMIPFESFQASMLNGEIAERIYQQAYAASAKLATIFGEPPICRGYGRRNATLIAIAPTKSSAFIMEQVSENAEPIRSNYQIKDLQKGKFTLKNVALSRVLANKGCNTHGAWESILKNKGSVAHLDCLDENEKAVFKTFAEISPGTIISQAAQRQKWIDQGQSINLLIDPAVPVKEVNKLIIQAWESGLKALYYQISVNAAQQLARSILTCASCEG